ncbi:MAG: hypothetical protein ACLFVW_01200 [Phycisphaerae bacterium]
MSRHSAVILKKGEFRTGEPMPLPAGDAGGKAAPQARARIARKTAQGAVIEVVCGCGQRIELHCSWGASATADRAEQSGNG